MFENVKANHRSTPLLLSHQQEHLAGVQMRSQGLTEGNLEEAAALYRDGWSLPRVAEQIGCSVGSVRKELKAHGVQIRPPSGWA